MHIALRAMNPHFMKIKCGCTLACANVSSFSEMEKKMRMPGFEPGPLTCFGTHLIFRERFPLFARRQKGAHFRLGENAVASVPIWSEQKGSWKAKILARLYYIRMFMRCPVPAGRRASAC